jgi:23S rRNA pseudouridine2605 synthase/23S rRNA pseudouridine2604 synthase
MVLVRLQKYLSDAGVCSRRKGENFIRAGRVRVNGNLITELGTKIDPSKDRVSVDNRPVVAVPDKLYIALHKPKGYITSCHHGDRKVVTDLVDLSDRIYPVGRLDKDSTGLLLLTNDGRIHHRLSHPSFDHEKEYEVAVVHPIEDSELKQLADGLPILGSKTRPAVVKRISGRRFRIILQEGRNRQIRRMVRHIGNTVKRLKRIRFAHIYLGDLPEGAWRYLTPAEKKKLLRHLESSDTQGADRKSKMKEKR